jgi:hypothetical protein
MSPTGAQAGLSSVGVALASFLVWGAGARADVFPCLCQRDQACCPPYYHPSSGYYPTQWRVWPAPDPGVGASPTQPYSEVPITIPASYSRPVGLTIPCSTYPSFDAVADQPGPRPIAVTPPDRATLLNLGEVSSGELPQDDRARPAQASLLNLQGAAPGGFPGMSYRNLP